MSWCPCAVLNKETLYYIAYIVNDAISHHQTLLLTSPPRFTVNVSFGSTSWLKILSSCCHDCSHRFLTFRTLIFEEYFLISNIDIRTFE